MPEIRSLQSLSAKLATFPMCAFNAPWQKYTTVMYSSGFDEWLDPLDRLTCTHAKHSRVAGGIVFKEAHRPTIIDPAPIVITAPMMIDPASPLCGRDSSIKRLVDLLVRTAVACWVHLEDTRLAAYRRLAHEIGKNISSPSRTAERVARLENELERARSAAIVRDDALRVVLAWLANELPGCWKWVQTWVPRGYKNNPLKFPHLASLHRCNRCGLQWRQVWTPNRLRRYEGAAHAERCSRPATWQLTTTKALDGELSTWLVTVLVHPSPPLSPSVAVSLSAAVWSMPHCRVLWFSK